MGVLLVGCRLKFSHFVGSRLKFSIFVGSRQYFSPFVARRFTPFTPSLIGVEKFPSNDTKRTAILPKHAETKVGKFRETAKGKERNSPDDYFTKKIKYICEKMNAKRTFGRGEKMDWKK